MFKKMLTYDQIIIFWGLICIIISIIYDNIKYIKYNVWEEIIIVLYELKLMV